MLLSLAVFLKGNELLSEEKNCLLKILGGALSTCPNRCTTSALGHGFWSLKYENFTDLHCCRTLAVVFFWNCMKEIKAIQF